MASFTEKTPAAGCWTHINFVEGLAEEEQGCVQRQLGGGVRAGLQLLVSGVFSELKQLLQLQSPGENTQAQQARPDPQPAPGPGTHLLSTDLSLRPAVYPSEESRGGGEGSGGTDSGGLKGVEVRAGVMNGWRNSESNNTGGI